MPFFKRKAEMLVVIGAGLGWADANICAQLPRGWRILYCLAQLERATFEQLFRAGAVHSRLTLREARQLLATHRGVTCAEKSRTTRLRQRFARFQQFVFETMSDWTSVERKWVRGELLELIDQIGASANRTDLNHQSDGALGATISLPTSNSGPA
jgi:hypothetical protein